MCCSGISHRATVSRGPSPSPRLFSSEKKPRAFLIAKHPTPNFSALDAPQSTRYRRRSRRSAPSARFRDTSAHGDSNPGTGRARCGRRHSPARALLGAAHLHAAGAPAQAASRRPLRARRASRRHQRALVLVDHQRRQRPRHAGRRRPELRPARLGQAIPAEGGRRAGGRCADRRRRDVEGGRLERPL